MMRNKKGWIFLMAILICFLKPAPFISAQDNENTRLTLRGLQGVSLFVEPLDPQIEMSGLTKVQIQTDTELRLKSAGIPVLVGGEFLKASGHPFLYVDVNISILKTQITRYLFYIRVELNQEVNLVRTPMTKVIAVTWSTGGWGIDFSSDNIRQMVKTQVDKFVNAYLTENPKP
ncbi:MAG: hypothetical protein HXY44_13005 [Syntrophaceae bacterium]|nr:hypothetical protein [Syntrophaceae bacterium]